MTENIDGPILQSEKDASKVWWADKQIEQVFRIAYNHLLCRCEAREVLAFELVLLRQRILWHGMAKMQCDYVKQLKSLKEIGR